ncbi:hypothetical protein SO802_025019 [Lithocarpus litseifolius]|uniref:Uncharacterized protein n=1 Tax=Lithocarpus litseifolius TaxID=425828 RepID=A0AAW2BZ22_9ROSI
MERLWFNEGKYKTRRFVFVAKAIATLREKAKSEQVQNPTRTEYSHDYNSVESTEIKLRDLVATLREAVAKIDSDVRILQGHECFTTRIKYLYQKAAMVFKNPESFGFTSWLTFGFDEIDFGWGKPIWVGLVGEGGSGRNLIVLQNTTSGNGIEAWVTLDENIMSILEQDTEFLAFATLNPSVLIQ